MTAVAPPKPASAAQAWARALERTAPIVQRPDRILPTVIDELAETYGDAPALVADAASLTYRQLATRTRQYARWALDHGVGQGDAVALLMPNCAEYLAIWLGITGVGGIVALLNTHLTGPALAHSLSSAAPRYVIAAATLVDRLLATQTDR